MAVLNKSDLELSKRNLIRSNGQGGLTKASELRIFAQHLIDTLFDLTNTDGLQNLVENLQTAVSDLQTEITDIQGSISTQQTNLDTALQRIQDNQNAIGALQNAISTAQSQIQNLQSSVNSNSNLIGGLQTKIDLLESQKAPVQVHFELVTLQSGTTVFVHNFNLQNPDAWQLSAKLNGEIVQILARTRDENSLFLTVNQNVTLSIFLTAKLD